VRPTYHLVPAERWAAVPAGAAYAAPSLEDEGFIHCTDGEDEVIATGERYYREDRRPYLVLTIDLDVVGVPWLVEDPAGIFPHVRGPIPPEAIVAVRRVTRAPDGAFVGILPGATGPVRLGRDMEDPAAQGPSCCPSPRCQGDRHR
jgi:uncharacterized protein (DUF952 family)